MSTIFKKKITLDKWKYQVSVERYNSSAEVVDDCRTRKNHDYTDKSQEKLDKDWSGVATYDEALDLLKHGYQPTVDRLQSALKTNKQGSGKRIQFENNIYGFAPIVPLALKGVPNSMQNMTVKPIKCKVIDIYYDTGVPCYISSDEIIKAGQTLLSAIIELEKQGYRFNLYAVQAYAGENDSDILCVKVKSSDKPIDLKRISFPLTHTAFFRVIGFDWQGKSPATKYRGSGRGKSLTNILYREERLNAVVKQSFGDNACYIACEKIYRENIDYIKEVLLK